jgi:hypothetical protein
MIIVPCMRSGLVERQMRALHCGVVALMLLSGMAGALAQGGPQARSGGARQNGDGLVAYWDFEEGSGVILHDRSGMGNDGAIHGCNWTTGRFGTALGFNGFSSYVEVANSTSLNFGTGGFSYSFWAKLRSNASFTAQLLCKRSFTGADYEVQLDYRGFLELYFGDSKGNYSHTFGQTALKLNIWYMVTVVRDGSAGYLYLN